MSTDWTQCDLVEAVSIACIKGTQIPAYFVTAANIGVNVGIAVSEVDKTVFDQLDDYTRDADHTNDTESVDWTHCDAVEAKPLVCVKGTDLPVYLALYDPYSEMVEGRIEPDMIDQLATYDANHFGEPVWTDHSITLNLGADEVDLIYRALSGTDETGLFEKLGLDEDEDASPAVITVTHQEAELIRMSIEFFHRATLPTLETRSDLANEIATLLYVKGVAPMPSL